MIVLLIQGLSPCDAVTVFLRPGDLRHTIGQLGLVDKMDISQKQGIYATFIGLLAPSQTFGIANCPTAGITRFGEFRPRLILRVT
jgi:hypothetical protein